jgi:Tol biopolymer transport system component
VFVVQADGSGQRQVVADMVLHGLAWSPDGRQLVFSNENNQEKNLVIVEVDGSGRKALTSPSRRFWDTGPVWSPDGRIFFTRTDRHANIGEIASIAPDGSGLETVTAAETNSSGSWVRNSFSLSPDGKWLLLCDSRAGSWVRMAANGHGAPFVVRKSPGDPRHGWAPQSSWSPDGSRIAFSVYTGGMTSGLFIMKADGSQLRKIAAGNNMQPMWQPR